jgi:hypothetical protein
VLAFAAMLPHHVTETELTAIEYKSRGAVVRLVRYTRELRELLVALEPQVTALEPPNLHDVFDREIAAITVEQGLGKSH